MKKMRVAILFGGRSAEHEVSLQSARNVIEALDKNKYNPVLIGIARDGRWFLNRDTIRLMNAGDPRKIQLAESKDEIALTPVGAGSSLINLSQRTGMGQIDVIFPVLHGPYGEDGTIQGLAKLSDIPCVGAGITGSAVGMDKDIMKRLLRDHKIPLGRFLTFQATDKSLMDYEKISSELGKILFVKPANLGSSVGISRVTNSEEFIVAANLAFSYDTKILIEEEIRGREIECAVLGNDSPRASIPGEIIPKAGFYSYAAKYIDDQGAELVVPAKLPQNLIAQIQQLAIATFKALECKGMARVDFFLTPDDRVLVNEINTIPGFTKISMYPRLWECSGISYCDLIDKLIQFAVQDFEKQKKLKTGMEFN
ncbi:MAG: D-alanine--D-alanine ligase [Bacteroidales bacterium]|nr:D-alanine--D-alanine ligase [Bacteroidales bacterium]